MHRILLATVLAAAASPVLSQGRESMNVATELGQIASPLQRLRTPGCPLAIEKAQQIISAVFWRCHSMTKTTLAILSISLFVGSMLPSLAGELNGRVDTFVSDFNTQARSLG